MKLTIVHMLTTALSILLLELGYDSADVWINRIGLATLAVAAALAILDLMIGALRPFSPQRAGHLPRQAW